MSLQSDFVGTLFDNENNPSKVTIAFSMGNKALEKGHSASIILMIEAVQLAVTGKFDSIDVGEPFKPAKELLEGFIAKGGKVLACKSCMVHHNITEDSIDPRFSVITADDVIDLTMSAKGTLQIT